MDFLSLLPDLDLLAAGLEALSTIFASPLAVNRMAAKWKASAMFPFTKAQNHS